MNPYLIQGPALISFSGGRTSAYMLHQIAQAHGGRLPDDVRVVFANTSKERPETLRFVHECGTRWGVDINWVEWRATPAQAEKRASLRAHLAAHDPDRRPVHPAGFERVGYNSASRAGEPFAALIAMKQRLPNWKERWCTALLKVEPMTAFARSIGLEPGSYAEVIGLRNDEGLRILKGLSKAQENGRRVLYPLAKTKVIKADVMAFWAAQPFDLGLRPHEGNCDLCFMKGRGLRKRIIRDDPGLAAWWDGQERGRDQFFDRRDRVRDLVTEVHRQPDLFAELGDDEYDAECGLSCAPDLEAAE